MFNAVLINAATQHGSRQWPEGVLHARSIIHTKMLLLWQNLHTCTDFSSSLLSASSASSSRTLLDLRHMPLAASACSKLAFSFLHAVQTVVSAAFVSDCLFHQQTWLSVGYAAKATCMQIRQPMMVLIS